MSTEPENSAEEPPAIADDFDHKAQPDEIEISAKIGAASYDIGPAYIIDNSVNFDDIDETTYESFQDKQQQYQIYQDAHASLIDLFTRMEEGADKMPIEIVDIYSSLVETEKMLASGLDPRDKMSPQILEDGLSAEQAIAKVTDRYITVFRQTAYDPEANTVARQDAKRRLEHVLYFKTALLRFARGEDMHSLDQIPEKKPHESPIPVAKNFKVGDLVYLRAESGRATKVHSLIRSEGTQGDHTEIIAGGLRVAVANTDHDQLSRIKHGDMIIVDGPNDKIIVNPTAETIARYEALMKKDIHTNKVLTRRAQERKWGTTLDGKIIKRTGNLAFSDEMYAIEQNNVSGISLYRSEVFVLMRRAIDSSVKTGVKSFAAVFNHIAANSIDSKDRAKAIALRTPDLIGDKAIKGLSDKARNKFIDDMITATLMAQRDNPKAKLSLMFPMIETQDEFLAMRERIQTALYDLRIQRHIWAGSMIETPLAVKNMKEMTADYYSVGTNDLIPLLLNYDRFSENEDEKRRYDPTDPLVMDALKTILETAIEKDRHVSICGDIAANPRYSAMLIGLGYRNLSSGAGKVPLLEELDTRLDTREAKALAEAMMNEPDREKREAMLDGFNEEKLGLCRNGTIDMNWVRPDGAPKAEQIVHLV